MNPGWATVIAALIGAAGLVVGGTLRDRWPSELRDASRLTSVAEKMIIDKGERRLVEEYRDDLVAARVVSRVSPHDSLWRTVGMYAAVFGMLFSLGTTFMFALVGWFMVTGTTLLPLLLPLLTLAIPAALCIALAGWAARKWQASLQSYMQAVRDERGMREPVSRWFAEREESYRHRQTESPIAPALGTAPRRAPMPGPAGHVRTDPRKWSDNERSDPGSHDA